MLLRQIQRSLKSSRRADPRKSGDNASHATYIRQFDDSDFSHTSINSALSIDLTSLESIRKCAANLVESTERIDALINNAGVMAIPTREITTDGFEKQLGVNHLGHYALTGLLFEHLKKSGNSRIVNVASSAHTFGDIDRNDLMLEKSGAYQAWKAYGNSKLANILFTKELTKKLYLRTDSDIAVVCCHPGKAIYHYFILSVCLSAESSADFHELSIRRSL